MKLVFLLITGTILVPVAAFSGPLAYTCKIKQELESGSDGSLKPASKLYTGKEFHIERATGLVLGDGLGNSAYPTKTVIDPGGPNTAYKLLSISAEVATTDRGRNTIYINVDEYADATKKPFLALEGSRVLTGNCE